MRTRRLPVGIGLLLAVVSLYAMVGTVSAQEGTGTLQGTITIIGDDVITNGEVVVSYSGTNEAAATAMFPPALSPARMIRLTTPKDAGSWATA